jgi:hypothetical protein
MRKSISYKKDQSKALHNFLLPLEFAATFTDPLTAASSVVEILVRLRGCLHVSVSSEEPEESSLPSSSSPGMYVPMACICGHGLYVHAHSVTVRLPL